MSQVLSAKLSAVRARHNLVALGVGVGETLVFVIAWLGVEMALDRVLELPFFLRVWLLAMMLVGVGWILAKKTLIPIVYGPDEDDLALAVEREWPVFGTRCIASIQLSRPGAVGPGVASALVEAMIAQTERMAEGVDFGQVIKTDYLLKVLIATLLAVIVAMGGWIWNGLGTRALLERAFLANTPLPTRTVVKLEEHPRKIAQGDDLRIRALANGYVPTRGRLEVQYRASGRKVSYTMQPLKENAALFTATMDAVSDSFSYRVWLYDGHSAWNTVQVVPRPAVKTLACTQVYPEYTGLAPEPRPYNDLALLTGSKLQVKITASKPVRVGASPAGLFNALRRFSGEGYADVVLQVNPQNRQELTAEMELPEGTTGFCVNLVDDDDLASKDAAFYRIDLLPDRPPTVHLTSPDRKEMLVTRVSKIAVGFAAEDDYGIASVTLKYRVDEGEVQAIPLDVPARQRALRNQYLWDIAHVPAPSSKPALEGCALEYWLEVTDNNTIGKHAPGRAVSDKYMLRVVTKAEKQAELMARLGESLGNIRDVSENQEKANVELGSVITGTVPRK